VPSTGSGHFLEGGISTSTQNITIANVTGGAAGSFNSGPTGWYHPSGGAGDGDANVQLAASNPAVGSIDAAYVLSSTAGSTTVTFTLSGTATSPNCWVYEVSYTNGPIQVEVPFAYSQTGGVAMTLQGTNDLIIQAINPSSSVSSINDGYTINTETNTAYLENKTNGSAPAWSLTPSSAVVNGLAVMEFPGPSSLNTQWVAFQRAGGPGYDSQCFNAGNISTATDGINITSQQATQTCASVDLAPTSYNYTSGQIAMRSFNFNGGTIEFYGKFGGGAGSGMWPAVWMLDSTCQPSDPTGTDNNCSAPGVGGDGEIDMTEITGTPTSINQEIHVAGGHNDGCTASVTDATTNYHDYKLVWVSGTSLTWYIDGVQTCSVVASYVPNHNEFVKIDMFMGNYGGTIYNSSLPWTSDIQWLTVTQGSRVVFFDDFPNTSNPTGYYLWAGTSLGTANLLNVGPLSGTSATVSLPTNGATIYVRLWTVLSGTTYLYNDYTYTEAP